MIQIYNTLTRQMEAFEPLEPGKVRMYVCGVTPYDYSHLGHMRPAVIFDVVRRYFMFRGYKVTYVVNFTDVDDKIIQRSREQGADPCAYAEPFITDYYEALGALNVLPADVYPRVSRHVPVIIGMIRRILENGYAYEANGDVYFSVRQFPDYGKLSNRSVDEMLDLGRIEHSPHKREPLDFALWKSAKEGEPAWDSPWGPGRPGWHIECSAMSTHYLGPMFDIHGGGSDLIFPHHENEIAQARACYGTPLFAKYWLHNGMVTLKQEKMSKSLKNFFAVRELTKRVPGEVLRFFLMSAHYRSPLDFSDEIIQSVEARLQRFTVFFTHLRQRLGEQLERCRYNLSEVVVPGMEEVRKDFLEAMDGDFNLPVALTALQALLDLGNACLRGDRYSEANRIYLEMMEFGGILGLFEREREWLAGKPQQEKTDTIPRTLIEALVQLRSDLRKRKEFALGDDVRETLRKHGVILEDTPQGTVWRRQKGASESAE
ncbi:MAG: cysteine--tRNA ligase [bacterium JZ-2024 1]